jgi:ABC-type antimicrobial peptide transport system permease subunit
VGIVDRPPLYYGANGAIIFTDKTTDLKPSNAAAEVMTYNISPGYFDAAQTALLAGRPLTWHDDRNSPRVAVINRQFAGKIFGSLANAVGSYYKRRDGTRIQVVGIVEDGKYGSLTEDPQLAMFLPIVQSPTVQTSLVVRSTRDPQQMVAAIKSTMHSLDAGLPLTIATWDQELGGVKLAPRMATISLGVLGVLGAMLAVTGIFGMASYSVSKRLREFGIRIALGAQHREVLRAALGRTCRLLVFGSAAGLLLGLAASKVLAFIVYQATPWDPLVLGGVLLTMLFLGLLAGWIPARRALSTDPLILLREE